MNTIRKLSFWKDGLGLLPIKHFSADEHLGKYILLNGNSGDFCLDTSDNIDSRELYFSYAWSSNTKVYVAFKDDKVSLFNWKEQREERYEADKVLNNLRKFHRYIMIKSSRGDADVIPFLLNIFKSLRGLFDDRVNPVKSINQLLYLFASAEDGESFNRKIWGIDETFVPISGMEQQIEMFKEGVQGNKPELDLIIRHSLGKVFQEASRDVIHFNEQLDAFSIGNISPSYHTRKAAFSSIHHTPSFLARSIVENALSKINLEEKNTLKILDPCCGSSEFLFEALKQLKESEYPGNIEITGWDSSEVAITTSKFLLNYEKRKNWDNKVRITIQPVEDSLKKDWGTDYDLILMNPPFMSWEQSNQEDRESIRESLGSVFSGKPNQASAFFYKAINSLSDNGVLGTVVPSSLLWLDSYKKIRKSTEELVTLSLIGRLGNYIFEDAFTDISVITAQKKAIDATPFVIWTRNEIGAAERALSEMRIMMYGNREKSTEDDDFSINRQDFQFQDDWKPVPAEDYELLIKLRDDTRSGLLSKVDDIFSVRQGIRSGNIKVFTIDKERYDELPKNEKKYFKPIVDNYSLTTSNIEPTQYIWYPYGKNGLIIRTEDELKKKAETYYSETLAPNKDSLEKRAGINKSTWWQLARPRKWLMTTQPKIISAEYGNSDSFIYDFKGGYAFERGLGWLPKKKLSEKDFYFYLAILRSRFFNKLISIYSRQLAGGDWYDLSRKYVKNIPLPTLTDSQESIMEISRKSDTYKLLADYGKTLTQGEDFFGYYPAIEDEIKTVIYKVW